MRNTHCRTWNMARNFEKCEIWEIHTVGHGLRHVNWKMWKMWHKHSMTWKIVRKLTNEVMRNSQGRTWNMARNTEKREQWNLHTVWPGILARNTKKREKWKLHTVGPGIWRETWKTRKMRNAYGRTWNMGRNTEKRGNWETHTVWPGIWQETPKNLKKWEMPTVGP